MIVLPKLGYLILISAYYIIKTSASPSDGREYDEFNMTTVEIIQKYGYPAEIHRLESEDGYMLEAHRIPHGKNSAEIGFPIVLAHGLFFDSSQSVLIAKKSLAFFLADEGYDVWLINMRGTKYTRAHKYLSPENRDFWDFTWHEYGVYDIPAYIEYICQYTKHEDVLFMGHSMGTTAFFVMASERPEYQKKVRGAAMLGPVATVKYSTSPLRLFSPAGRGLQIYNYGLDSVLRRYKRHGAGRTPKFLSERLLNGELRDQSPAYQFFVRQSCTLFTVQQRFCRNIVFVISGFNPEGFEERVVANLISHSPTSTSTKTIEHYAQLMNSGKFRQYDYGLRQNLARYKWSSPPEYNLRSITTPMCLFVGYNDILATPRDISETLAPLPSVKSIYYVPEKRFTHIDFFAGKNVEEVLYPALTARLKYLLNRGQHNLPEYGYEDEILNSSDSS